MKIGIVGLPNVGKSTLFNALTRQSVDAANYPFCTIDPSVGIVPVPDERLEALARLSRSQEVIPAVVEFVDIAGLVAGASKGEGLGNQFLSHIREVDALAQVVRVFDDSNITHVSGAIDPLRDIEVITMELALADLETVTKRLGNIERDVKSGDKEAALFKGALERIQKVLETGTPARNVELTKAEQPLVKQLNLLTRKPMLYVLNTKESVTLPQPLAAFFSNTRTPYVVVNAKVEEDIKDIEGKERMLFRNELGATHSNLDALVQKAYELLELITFFTTGEKETRGWTIQQGSTAPEAGRAIHGDFHDKFIRASVIYWEELVEAGSYARAREKGLVRTEGKEYIVQDGDVIEFRI
jgi:hypothetical protein